MGYFKRRYRKTFGHKSPFRRVYGSRNPGQAIGVSYRQLSGPMKDIAKLYSEVRGIKSRQNVEKKHSEKLLTTGWGDADEAYYVGQVNKDDEGCVGIDVTPAMTQGIQHDQRIGNSLKMTGMVFKYQLQQQTNNHQAMKVKMTLVKASSPDIASIAQNEVRDMIWDVNPLTNVRDTNAPLNYATLKQNGIKIIRTHTCYLRAQQMSSTVAISAKSHKTSKFSVALQDIVRFASASATTPEGHRYFLFLQTDVGNVHQTDDSTKDDIPITEKQSGGIIRLHAKYWWVDN